MDGILSAFVKVLLGDQRFVWHFDKMIEK